MCKILERIIFGIFQITLLNVIEDVLFVQVSLGSLAPFNSEHFCLFQYSKFFTQSINQNFKICLFLLVHFGTCKFFD